MGFIRWYNLFPREIEQITIVNIVAPLSVQSGYSFIISTFNSCIAPEETVMLLLTISVILYIQQHTAYFRCTMRNKTWIQTCAEYKHMEEKY